MPKVLITRETHGSNCPAKRSSKKRKHIIIKAIKAFFKKLAYIIHLSSLIKYGDVIDDFDD